MALSSQLDTVSTRRSGEGEMEWMCLKEHELTIKLVKEVARDTKDAEAFSKQLAGRDAKPSTV